MSYYVLDASGEPQRVANVMEWAEWLEGNFDKKRVGRTEVDGVEVSTVFLGTDHAWGMGPPLLFETMIFGGQWNSYQWRWTTRVQAQAGHDRIVAALRAGNPPEDAEES